MTDKTSRYLIQTTLSLSSRGIRLQAGLPSHIQEEAIPSLDTRPNLTMDNLDIPNRLSMGNLSIPLSLQHCILSCRVKVTHTQVTPPPPWPQDMASLLLNHFMSSLDFPSLCLRRG